MAITLDQVITRSIEWHEWSLCCGHAKSACIGGASNVRGEDRMERLLEDQIVGQVGTYVGTRHFLGDAQAYRISRWYANQHPTLGDGGSDIPGSNVDFKTSLMRSGRDPLNYRLLVRPRERHAGWVYVLILVDPALCGGSILEPERLPLIHIVGWISDDHLPTEPAKNGVFKGAFVLPARNLNPVPPYVWACNEGSEVYVGANFAQQNRHQLAS